MKARKQKQSSSATHRINEQQDVCVCALSQRTHEYVQKLNIDAMGEPEDEAVAVADTGNGVEAVERLTFIRLRGLKRRLTRPAAYGML